VEEGLRNKYCRRKYFDNWCRNIYADNFLHRKLNCLIIVILHSSDTNSHTIMCHGFHFTYLMCSLCIILLVGEEIMKILRTNSNLHQPLNMLVNVMIIANDFWSRSNWFVMQAFIFISIGFWLLWWQNNFNVNPFFHEKQLMADENIVWNGLFACNKQTLHFLNCFHYHLPRFSSDFPCSLTLNPYHAGTQYTRILQTV